MNAQQKKETHFKGMKDGKVKALAKATTDKLAKEAAEQLEAMGCTAHVITEFEFWVLHNEAKDESRIVEGQIMTDKPLTPTQAAEIIGRFA